MNASKRHQGNGRGADIDWTWGRGPLLNRQFPWHYPQPHSWREMGPQEVWGARRPLALYLHTPFCVEKCDYCNYATYGHRKKDSIRRYVDALEKEIGMVSRLSFVRQSEATSVYFGGGSPSILDNEWLLEVMDLVRDRFAVAPDAEVCIESNPIDISAAKLETFKAMGVNRVSLGVQSFDPETLASMRRAHSSDLAVQAFQMIREAGFGNVNIDLIYAYPTQTLPQLAKTIEQTLELSPDRISCASLSIFPKTELYHKVKTGKAVPLTEDDEVRMFDLCLDMIPPAGYEVSTVLCFNKPGIRFRQEDDVLRDGVGLLGLGLSSFSVVNGSIYENAAALNVYYKAVEEEGRLPIHRGRRITKPMEIAMSVIQGLRYLEIDRVKFANRFGVSIERIYGDKLEKLVAGGLLEPSGGRYALTREGMVHVGPIMREFYLEPPIINQSYHGEVVKEKPEVLVALGH